MLHVVNVARQLLIQLQTVSTFSQQYQRFTTMAKKERFYKHIFELYNLLYNYNNFPIFQQLHTVHVMVMVMVMVMVIVMGLRIQRMMLSFYFRQREDDGMSGVLPTRISEGTSFYFLHILTMTMTKTRTNTKIKRRCFSYLSYPSPIVALPCHALTD